MHHTSLKARKSRLKLVKKAGLRTVMSFLVEDLRDRAGFIGTKQKTDNKVKLTLLICNLHRQSC